jgi:hypothetical protein
MLNDCISKNIWSWELIFGGESAMILKSSKMNSICENHNFGRPKSWTPPPPQISIWNLLKIQWKYNENINRNQLEWFCSALISVPCDAFIVPKLLRNDKTHYCAVCHPKTSIWTTIFDEVDFGLPALGRQPLKTQFTLKQLEYFMFWNIKQSAVSSKINPTTVRWVKIRKFIVRFISYVPFSWAQWIRKHASVITLQPPCDIIVWTTLWAGMKT